MHRIRTINKPNPKLFALNEADACAPDRDPLIGLRVHLARVGDPHTPCCQNVTVICVGEGSHPYTLNCEDCGRYRGSLSDPVIKFLREIVKNFGTPVEPVRIKDSGSDPECESAASPAMHT
jgi:hypothetical protein